MQLAGPLKSYPFSRFYKVLIILSISFFFSNEAFSKSFKTKEDFLNSTLPYFADSLNYIQKAFSVDPKDVRTTKEGYKTGTLTESEHKKILGFAKSALQSSYKVSKKDLDAWDKSLFYKTLSDNYFNKFQKGLVLYVDAWENGNTKKALEANKLLNEWGKYYRKYRKKLLK
jgi:hypothetical protein